MQRTITIDSIPTYHVAPEDQGQTIEVAYAAIEDGYLRRTTDQSYAVGEPERESYAYCSHDDAGDIDWSPWSEAPEIAEEVWERVSVRFGGAQ